MGARNRSGRVNLLCDGLLGSGRWGRNCSGNLSLEFTDSALKFGELLGVFVGEIVQLFSKFGLPYKKRNEQKWHSEKRQPIEQVQ